MLFLAKKPTNSDIRKIKIALVLMTLMKFRQGGVILTHSRPPSVLNETPAEILSREFCLVTKHLFAEHLQKAVSVIFSQVLLFPIRRVARL